MMWLLLVGGWIVGMGLILMFFRGAYMKEEPVRPWEVEEQNRRRKSLKTVKD